MSVSPGHVARVVFDEAHSEAWSIRPELARRMQPTHPADASLAIAAAMLDAREFEIAVHGEGPISDATLGAASALVIAHPSDQKWEATTGAGEPRFAGAEIEAIERFVDGGGGLIVLGETEEDKYGSNLNDLLARFGLGVANETVQDYSRNHRETPSWILADLERPAGEVVDLRARVSAACFYRAGTLILRNGAAPIARTAATASVPRAPLAAISRHGRGRVVAVADSDLFGDDCIGELDHSQLWLNLAYWAAGRAFTSAPAPPRSALREDPAWPALRDAVDELRGFELPDGSVDGAAVTAADADLGALVDEMIAAIDRLAVHVPHQAAYLEALRADLATWAAGGFGKPDFIRSTEAFRPERDRRDGIEHLVVFPMYKQNASRDTAFEALIVRVPWPDWIAELERSRFDNAKFLPVELVAYTAGYESECAVLFPETFSTAERPPAHFGAIFCDREAERLRRVAGAAAVELGLNLPPDAAALLTSPRLSRDAYILWDLVHDRTHMRGDLPFDPFMIRQRSPYWMYSLEELRCDLTAFAEAVRLERDGLHFARHVQYAILFDRLFRFPLTGSRIRNYDGLGGQLLFAYLHREGYLHWTDNRLTIDWPRVADGAGELGERIHDLYHSGIDRSKVGQWIAAHELVAEFVEPAQASVWARSARALPEVDDPRQLVDLVLDDEFPLSLFYAQLWPRLEAFLARPSDPDAASSPLL